MIEGAQKAVKMYDSLMKSGKFTAAQNKTESGNVVDSISEVVAMCEKDGFIPRFYTDGPQDKVDRTIQDLQNYTRELVLNETDLSGLIDKAVKDINEQKEREAEIAADAADDEEAFEAGLFAEDGPSLLRDEDFAELWQQEEIDSEADDAYFASLLEDGELG